MTGVNTVVIKIYTICESTIWEIKVLEGDSEAQTEDHTESMWGPPSKVRGISALQLRRSKMIFDPLLVAPNVEQSWQQCQPTEAACQIGFLTGRWDQPIRIGQKIAMKSAVSYSCAFEIDL